MKNNGIFSREIVNSPNRNFHNLEDNQILEHFKIIHLNFLTCQVSQIVSPSEIVEALKQLAEFIIWDDSNSNELIFE